MGIYRANWAKTVLTSSSLNTNKANFPFLILPIILAIFVMLFLTSPAVFADDFPPYWDNTCTPPPSPCIPPVHYPPVYWPADDATWIDYTHQGDPIRDQRDADPSNGGRAPQNYANVSSSCTDQLLPSVAWYYDDTSPYWLPQPTMFFRWRVEQIPNTYATGPAPGPYSAIDPWKAAQWTVLMDINGDGYYDFAVHIDGTSGTPGADVDIMRSIYNTTKSQSTEIDGINIFELAHNPTAFVYNDPGQPGHNYILNFRNDLNPTYDWPNGSAETVWDYGTTRVTNITEYDPLCIEYNVDYQIPLAMLDASDVGGPTFDADTPFCMTFVTANSNTDPLQKDVVFDGAFTFSVDDCIPCGDLVTLNGGALIPIPQPTVDWVTANGCGSTVLTAQVRDAIKPGCQDTLNSVNFYYYYDANGNGIPDDPGSSWTSAGPASVDPDNPSLWKLTNWDTTILMNGQYLIGVQATDLQGNITFSYFTQAEVDALKPIGDEPWYANPSPVPGVVYDTFINSCGMYIEVTKSVIPSFVSKGNLVTFTITVNNQTGSALTVSKISDVLPPNFTYNSNAGGTLPLSAPTSSPGFGTTGTIEWTYAPTVIIAAGGSSQLVFTADTNNVLEGTYTNVASADTSEGTLTSDPVDVSVGAPRLTISKTSDKALVSPGETVAYTITYSNDSPVNVTNVVITDELPIGLTFVSATNGGTYDSATHTITWNLGSLASLEGPYEVSYQVTVDADASAQPQNYACIISSETTEACTTRVVIVNTPLKLQKSATPVLVNPGANVTFTMNYTNAGTSPLNNTVITDPVPTGFSFSSSATGTNCPAGVWAGPAPGTVTWTLTTPLTAGTSGTCTFVATASNPYSGSNPATNTATISAASTPSVSDSAQVGVVQGPCTSPVTYHMHASTLDVGFDGTQKIANTTTPTSLTDTIINSPQGAATPVEFARFYQDPPLTSGGTLANPVTISYWAKKTQGNPAVYAYLYDYNPDTGAKTLLGSGSASAGGTLKEYTISFAPSGSVYEGHRLLWIFAVQGNGATIDFHYDSTTHSARSNICFSPTLVVMNKTVNNITASQGNQLIYTINFGNPSTQNITGAQIIDTLPAGVVLNSVRRNGNLLTLGVDYTCSGQVCTIPVRTSELPAPPVGQLTSGRTGYLTITVTIENPIIFDHNPLVNVAVLNTNQTEPISDTATTNVTGAPILGIKKRVNDTLLRPGDTTTFYIDITNIGNTTQGLYTVTDYIDGRSYLNFAEDDISDGGSLEGPGGPGDPCDPGDACTITWDLTNLGPNQTRTVYYVLRVSPTIDPTVPPLPFTGGVPNGFTTEQDYAEVDYGSLATSNTVTVTLYTNANLHITKTADPEDPSPGDTVEYTITVENVGATDATDVQVTDPIPTYTSYNSGTLEYGVSPPLSPQTDINDYPLTDNSHFDAMNKRVVYIIGTLASGSSRTMSFSVTLDSTLPAGTTTITNTATAYASNTASKQAIETFDVSTIPDLTLTKSAPAVIPYPLTTVNGNHVNQTNITVYNVQYIYAGDVIYLDGAVRTVTAVNPTANQITVDSPVSIGNNRPVEPTIKYRLVYTNNGDADATNVTVTDILDTTPQLNYITASPAPTSAPAVDTNGTVTWNLGTVAAGETRSILLWTRPTSAGTYNNTATMSSSELPLETSNTKNTIVGAIELTKSTSTPTIASGAQATYTITLTNQVALATTVDVTDNLPEGFTYNSTTGGAAGCTLPEAQPSPDPSNPVWSACPLAASGTLTITFIADVATTVGAGTYQNPVSAASLDLSVLAFDELLTTAEDVTVTVQYDLKVTKEVTNFDGTNVTYLITVTNVGTNDLAGTITDILPSGVTYVSDDSSSDYDPDTGDNTWDTGTVLAPSQVMWPAMVGQNYICIQSHDGVDPPPSVTEPGVGTNWQAYWVVGGSTGSPWVSGQAYNAAGSATLTIDGTVGSLTDTIQNCAQLTNSTPADSNTANDKGCADLYPTLVTLSGFRAYENNGRVVVEWTTASEIGTAGFYLFRLDDSTGEYIQMNNTPLPSLLTSRIGGTYSLIDKSAFTGETLTYLLVELEAKGTKITYGPFTVEVGGESVTSALNTSSAAELVNECTSPRCQKKNETRKDKIEIHSDSAGNLYIANKTTGEDKKALKNTVMDQYESYTKKPRVITTEKKARLKALKDLRRAAKARDKTRTGNAIKISVASDGMYYLDATEISSLLDINSNNIENMIKNGQLTLRNQGQDVAYLPAEDNKGLYFYGKGIESTFTNENIYWLKQGKGIQMEEIKGKGPSSSGQGAFTKTVHAEENIFWCPELFTDPTSDFWLWDYIIAGWSPKSYTIMAKGITPSVVPATLTVTLHGFTNYGPGLDHHAVISMNGQQIGEGQFDASDPKTIVLPFDQDLLVGEANTIEVKGLLDPGVIYSVFYVESFDLTYQRHYAAENDTLVFKGEGNPVVTVQGFSNSDIFVFDITDPNRPKKNEAVTIDGTQVSLTPTSPDTEYLACTLNAVTTGPDMWADVPSELSSEDNWNDYLIIAPGEFTEAANTFAAYRQSKGLETMVVQVEDIMDEFNYGNSSPMAIRDLLTYAYSHWGKPPRYVLIAGDGSYDYKNYLGYSENLVPVLLTETPWGLYPSDTLLADFNGDHVPEMAIGRLPVLTPQELLDVLEKIKIYETSLQNRVILLADDPDIGGDFPADSDEIAGLVPLSYQVEKIYLTDQGQIDTVRDRLLTQMNIGAFLLNYIGHASYDLLAFEGLLTTADLPSLTNLHGLPVLTAMTCMVGMYTYPGFDTLSEALVLKNNGGAIAAWVPTGLSYNSMAKALDEEFFKAAFDGNEEVLGEVILNAQEGYHIQGKSTYLLDIFNLLGDPALKLR